MGDREWLAGVSCHSPTGVAGADGRRRRRQRGHGVAREERLGALAYGLA